MLGTTQEEHPLGHGRFPSIDVRDDADVTKFGDIKSHENDSGIERLGRQTEWIIRRTAKTPKQQLETHWTFF